VAAIEVKVPDIGDFDEIPVIEVLVKPGDTVKKDDSLVTLESDKATMEVPSPIAGVVKDLKVKVGDKVSEGSLILTLDGAGAAAAPAKAAPAPAPAASAKPAPVPAPKAARSRRGRSPGRRTVGTRSREPRSRHRGAHAPGAAPAPALRSTGRGRACEPRHPGVSHASWAWTSHASREAGRKAASSRKTSRAS
jgi:pyruvate dehydrogenase E2 component (dihydrolipoamide acetyltransferase)